MSAVALAGAVVSCARSNSQVAEPVPLIGKATSTTYIYATPEGEPIGSAQMLGRETVLMFVTTYDDVSLAMTRRLSELQRRRTPRFNALLVALEPAQNAMLVAVYRDSLPERFPVALADQSSLDGGGPFGDMRAVPGLVLLDRDGRLVYRGFGVDAFRRVSELLMASASAR